MFTWIRREKLFCTNLASVSHFNHFIFLNININFKIIAKCAAEWTNNIIYRFKLSYRHYLALLNNDIKSNASKTLPVFTTSTFALIPLNVGVPHDWESGFTS